MTDGFRKIELGGSVKPTEPSIRKLRSPNILKILGVFLVGSLVVLLILVAAVILPGKDLYGSIQKTAVVGRQVYTAVKNQDIEEAERRLSQLEDSLLENEKQLSRLAWFKHLPFIGIYEADAEHLVNAGKAGVEGAKITVSTLVPYADLLGLKGKSTFVEGSADDRIKTAVETLDKVTPKLNEIAQKIATAGEELDKINPGRYPEKLGPVQLRSRLETVKDLFSQTAKLFVDAQPLFKKVPELLGVKTPKTYLALFQNDAELRATGGFITAYAIFKVDKGKMQVIKADDIYKLDEAKRKKYPVPKPILKYHKDVLTFEIRDSNLSPDFITSMRELESMLKDSIPDFPKFDGIIAVDTHILVSTIKILGDFNVYGRVFSAENDRRCDCPSAIYELEDYATRPVAYVREERKDIIGVLLYQIMQRALGVSPSKYWGNLFQMFLEEAKQKHVLFYFHDEEAQRGIESLNFGGRIISADGDYLHVNNVNFAGAKSNMFVKQSVKQEINLDVDGTVAKTLNISYKNPAPPSNCNLEAGQLCLNGILRNWLRVYVPAGSTLLEFTGSEKETVTYDELGKTVFEGFLTVKPQGAAQVRIRYKLPFKATLKDQYKLYIQKQPGTDADEYTVVINSKKTEKFNLSADQELTIKL